MNRFKTLSKSIITLLLLVIATVSLQGEEASGIAYLFEGEITRIENSMAPTLREGQVLSGSFSYLENNDALVAASPGVYENALGLGEFTIDQNYVRVYAADAGEGLNSLTLTQGDADDETFDTYGILLPVKGPEAGEGLWTVRWMQIWLYGEPRRWLSNLKPQGPPDGYLRGWFRLTFWSASLGKEGVCEGPITYFGKAGDPLTPAEEIEMLERVVAELGTQLKASQEREERLAESLASSRQRIKGLNETIDGLMAEREALKSELYLAEMESGGGAFKAELERLQADEAMWSEMRGALESQNVILATSLAESESERRAMEDELATLREWQKTLSREVVETTKKSVQTDSGAPKEGVAVIEIPPEAITETITVIEPLSETTPSIKAEVIESEEAPIEVESSTSSEVDEVTGQRHPGQRRPFYSRMKGPSKFRGRRF